MGLMSNFPRIRSEIRDQNLFVYSARFFLGGVGEFYGPDAEAAEQIPDRWKVVQRQDKFAFERPQPLFKSREVSLVEVVTIEFPPPVRRVEIEKCRRAVIPVEDLIIWQTFDLYPFQPLMGMFNDLGKTFQVESGRLDDVPMVIRIADEARERALEDIKVPRSTLNIGQGLR